jgi:hypothetical protein
MPVARSRSCTNSLSEAVLDRASRMSLGKPRRSASDTHERREIDLNERDDLVTEDPAALEFAARFEGQFLFDHEAGSWFDALWQGPF